jgi:uncharacterized protein (TIGR00266 family)
MQTEIKGTTMPVLEVTLDSGEEVISTHGELSWMTPNIVMSQSMGGSRGAGGGGGLLGGLKRVVGGGGLFITRYECSGGAGLVAFAAKLPGHIMPVDIASGSSYYVHKHGWLCATPGVVPSVGLQQSFRGGLWGGDGFILQKLEGQGRAWVELSGELTHYTLGAGQSLMVHPGHVGMFEGSVSFQITRVPGIMNKVFGGDGYHLVALTGPGQIWLQSMPISILAHSLEPYLATQNTGQSAAAGGIGGMLGDMMRGN